MENFQIRIKLMTNNLENSRFNHKSGVKVQSKAIIHTFRINRINKFYPKNTFPFSIKIHQIPIEKYLKFE